MGATLLDKIRVLLIEDDETSIIVTKELLERAPENFIIDTAKTLREGINKLKKCLAENLYDVVLLDLILPNGEGLKVFKKIKDVCIFIPIIIVSGFEDKAIECVRYGAQDYLLKPYLNSKILAKSILYAIERFNSDKKYKRLVESTHASIYEIDVENERFSFVNDVFCEEMGVCNNDLMNTKISDVFTKHSYQTLKERIDNVINKKDNTPVVEYEFITKCGNRKWFLVTSEYIKIGGEVVRISSIAINITEKKEQENRIKSILKTAPVIIGYLNNDRVIYDINDRACDVLGYARDELVGSSVRILYENDDEYERVGKIKYEQIKQYGIGTLETQWKTKDGELVDILLSTSCIDKKNPCLGATFSALDITEKKKYEKELEEILDKKIDEWKNEVFQTNIESFNKLADIVGD
jgi:PAS domain S-box-containing protein